MDSIPVCRSNAFEICLTIASEVEQLKTSKFARDIQFLKGYTSLNVSDSTDKIKKINIHQIALDIVNLCDENKEYNFVDSTLKYNWRLTPRRNSDGTYESLTDPFALRISDIYKHSTKKGEKTGFLVLGEARMITLVRALRFYISQTIVHFFPSNLDPSEWDPSIATYQMGYGKNAKKYTDDEFSNFFFKIFQIFSHLESLTDDLIEITQVAKLAIEKGNEEKELRNKERQMQQDNFNKSKRNAANDYIKSTSTTTNTEQSQIKKPSKLVVPRVVPESAFKIINWSSGNPLTGAATEVKVIEKNESNKIQKNTKQRKITVSVKNNNKYVKRQTTLVDDKHINTDK